jgi:hypothetical protein
MEFENMLNKNIKIVCLSILISALVCSQIGNSAYIGDPSTVMSLGKYSLSPFDYLVEPVNSTYYQSVNGSGYVFQSTNRTHVETLCVNNLTSSGGIVFLKNVQWNTSITRPSTVQIFESYQGNFTFWGDNTFWVNGVNKTETLDNLDCPVATSDTFTLANSVAEQTLLEFNVETTNITEVNQLYLDLDALTKNCTIKVYFKVDGTNYRESTAMRLTNLGSANQLALVLSELKLACDMKVTITSIELEGATRAVPYVYILTVW